MQTDVIRHPAIPAADLESAPLAQADTRERFLKMGSEPTGGSPEAFLKLQREEGGKIGEARDGEEALAQIKGLTFLSGAEQISPDWLGTPEAPGKFADTLLATGEFLVNQGKIPTAPTLEALRAGIATQLLQQAFGQ